LIYSTEEVWFISYSSRRLYQFTYRLCELYEVLLDLH